MDTKHEHLQENHMKIYAVHLAEYLDSEFAIDRYLPLLPPERQDKIRRFLRWGDRLRSLAGDCLIRNLAAAYAGCRPGEIRIATESKGKPVLPYEEMHFNLSHANAWVVCAIDRQAIGVDVEEIKPIDFGIARRFFTGEEYAGLLAEPDERQLERFFELWTLKESYVKRSGNGLSESLDSFNIRRSGKEYYEENGSCFFHQYEIDAGYKLSVCAGHSHFPTDVIRLRLADVLSEFS